jgi:hypothetical protein
VKELSSGRTATGTTTIELDGLRFAIEGTPRNGDTFRISPEDHPAATFSALIKDGSQVASAGRFAIRADISNLGASAAEMTITEPRASVDVRSIEDILPSPKTPVGEETFTATGINAYQDTIIAARTGPIAVIPAGYTKIALTTAIGEGSELAVFTRDGLQHRERGVRFLFRSDLLGSVFKSNGRRRVSRSQLQPWRLCREW